MDNDYNTVNLHIEVCQRSESSLGSIEIEKALDKFFTQQEDLELDSVLLHTVLPNHVSYIRLSANSGEKTYAKINCQSENIKRLYHIYQAWNEGPQTDYIFNETEEIPDSLNWCLPNAAFEGLWESLIIEDGVKEKLIAYVETALLYSSRKVNSHIVHWNGVVLLHGPPGTGKTSLCKALAQKLSIRLNAKYDTCHLIEINTHSLFSKWFSESAKLVLKMFNTVKQWLQSPNNFVCVLIDEVESLTHAREATGAEPTDAIRVVNAVLTQIDQLQKYPNVLILATSNMTAVIDLAFADRADLKLCIPYPSEWAIYEILRSCFDELIRCELINGDGKNIYKATIYKQSTARPDGLTEKDFLESKELMDLSSCCKGLSGRTLRKIPFLTSARFLHNQKPTIKQFAIVMRDVIKCYKVDNEKFNKKSKY